MYVGMPVETTTVSVDGAENADIHPASAGRSERLTSNSGYSKSGRVKTRCIQSQSGRRAERQSRYRWLEGQVRQWRALVMYFTCGQAELSLPYSFTPVMKISQASILVTASTSISRRPRTSRNEIRYWLAVNSFLSGRGVKPESMKQIKLLLSADGRGAAVLL